MYFKNKFKSFVYLSRKVKILFSLLLMILTLQAGAMAFEIVVVEAENKQNSTDLFAGESVGASTNIIGWLDFADCTAVHGWTGDKTNPNQPIDVHFYNGQAGNGGVFIGSMVANRARERGVCEALGGTNCNVCLADEPQCQHGYTWTFPDILKDGRSHDIYAYGVNSISQENAQLRDGPHRLTCTTSANEPKFTSIWDRGANTNNTSLAWGDVDNDGDLDLAVGNADAVPLQLYLNQGNGDLVANWQPDEADRTFSLAWGDVDNDGDLDLAVGNTDVANADNAHNRIYRNDGLDEDGNMGFTLVWISDESQQTTSVAWGDMNNDGYLDLAVGNADLKEVDLWIAEVTLPDGHPNYVYLNEGMDGNGEPQMRLDWQSREAEMTTSLAWGDMNNDGYLDLAVGNANFDCDPLDLDCDTGKVNRVYLNVDGRLIESSHWSSVESEATTSIAWGDYDDDGDLDLAVGNMEISVEVKTNGNLDDVIEVQPLGHPNRIYRNEDGMLQSVAFWSSQEEDPTTGIAWGDMDNDGDLDLAVANTRPQNGEGDNIQNKIYENEGLVLKETRSLVICRS